MLGAPRPLVLGQGELDSAQYDSHAACLGACRVVPPETPRTWHFTAEGRGNDGVCQSGSCLCFQCQHDTFSWCRRCYGLPLQNCASTRDPHRRCIDKAETWSWRATLEKEGCCEVVHSPGTPHALDVAVVDSWRPLVQLGTGSSP